jgi:hypothetical protein
MVGLGIGEDTATRSVRFPTLRVAGSNPAGIASGSCCGVTTFRAEHFVLRAVLCCRPPQHASHENNGLPTATNGSEQHANGMAGFAFVPNPAKKSPAVSSPYFCGKIFYQHHALRSQGCRSLENWRSEIEPPSRAGKTGQVVRGRVR